MAENKDDHEMKRKGEIRDFVWKSTVQIGPRGGDHRQAFPTSNASPLPNRQLVMCSKALIHRQWQDSHSGGKVKHHKFFHAHRINGRLTLQLVKMVKEPTCPDGLGEKEEEEKKVESGAPMKRPMLFSLGVFKEEEEGGEMSRVVSSPELLLVSRGETSLVGVGGGGKCLGMKRSDSLFQMTTPHVINS